MGLDDRETADFKHYVYINGHLYLNGQLEELITKSAGKNPAEVQAEKQQILNTLYTLTGGGTCQAAQGSAEHHNRPERCRCLFCRRKQG